MVLSHHNNRIEYAIPPVYLLPEVCKLAGDVPVFVDGMIQTGMDAFKALALGAKGVCIGRPLMAAYTKDKENGVSAYLKNARDELAKAMAYTGCTDLGKMDPSVIHVVK
jgi:isopentenyl diphosphate isomerase/L-lactate dehydrogenase-like FMN-dependent dehydrogenase